MSGGGVFSMDGKLLLIDLRGEKDIWESNLNIDGRPLKSGTNYGIPALLALKEAQKLGFNFALAPSAIKIRDIPKMQIVKYSNLNTFALAQAKYKEAKIKEEQL